MRKLTRADSATALLAGRLKAVVGSNARRQGTLVISGRRVAADLISPPAQLSHRPAAKPPRLRFDRVALGLLRRVRQGVHAEMPRGWMVALTVTAPIRLAGQTAITLEERIRVLLKARLRHTRGFKGRVHGNGVQIRVLRSGGAPVAQFVGFIHNPTPDPGMLFDLTNSLLRAVGSLKAARRGSRKRALVVAIADARVWTLTYGQVCAQLFADTHFRHVLLMGSDTEVLTLSE
jgi:hypothetical protein